MLGGVYPGCPWACGPAKEMKIAGVVTPRKACPELAEGRESSGLREQSFPQKRESTPQTFGNVLSSDWIPAGMTHGWSGSPF